MPELAQLQYSTEYTTLSCTMPKVKRGRLRAARGAKQTRRPKQDEGTSKKPTTDRGEESTATDPVHVSSLASKLVEQFRRGCCDHVTSHPECKKDALWMEKYMKNQFRFFGLKSPVRRVIEKDILDTNKMALQDRTTLMGVVTLLWEQEEREFQYFGGTLLEKYRQSLMGSSDLEFHEAMETVKKCICTKSWWDTIDMLASHGEEKRQNLMPNFCFHWQNVNISPRGLLNFIKQSISLHYLSIHFFFSYGHTFILVFIILFFSGGLPG